MNTPAEVIEVMGRSGAKGIYRVRCRLMEEGKSRVIVRNVLGPIRIGDIVMISEKEMEASGAIG